MADSKKYNAPLTNPETAPFWEAAKAGKFMIKRCTACGEPHYFPRWIYAVLLLRQDGVGRELGEGTIYTWSLTARSRRPGPTRSADVALKEGPSLQRNFVDCDLEKLKIGQKVKVVWKPTDWRAPAVLHAGLSRRSYHHGICDLVD